MKRFFYLDIKLNKNLPFKNIGINIEKLILLNI